ncbi:ABC transporter ATP-binding protein [Evansella halocellulosilytica]|uniref:ABC transporter ATP-binding protein n=1 Tax=Evansella halocellulosilytica TaxID=2011013 RepID=UPI000BB7C6BF|nr:ABC transporter ATP-binding protein [Evansella halocellulosilytica]
MPRQLLHVNNLVTQFSSQKKPLSAVKGISFTVEHGETVCIVGESGCGKSITALSIMGLLPRNANIVEGSINFNDTDLTKLSKEEMQKVRGNEISMIFQEPMTALNPVFSIGFQIREVLMNHLKISKREAHQQGIELLKQVEISSPEKRMHQYPHELSGGMRQRVMIAIGLACNPKLLIADEPTTALDVTIQAQILELIQDLKDQYQMSVILITHDMGVVAQVADRVIVMYAGEIIEEGDVESIFNNAQHPYTKGLLNSVPHADSQHNLEPIPGSLPTLNDQISGCAFHPRCKYVMDKCKQEKPANSSLTPHHKTTCWLQEVNEDDPKKITY